LFCIRTIRSFGFDWFKWKPNGTNIEQILTLSYLIFCQNSQQLLFPKSDENVKCFFQLSPFFLKNIFFCCDLPLLAVFIIFILFCHQVVYFIYLVFRKTWELNSRPRTMAQTVSPRRSPLDQGASLTFTYLGIMEPKAIWRHFVSY
jgi:hypothetical protein